MVSRARTSTCRWQDYLPLLVVAGLRGEQRVERAPLWALGIRRLSHSLIAMASLSVSPEAPVFEARSEPARSTRLILELVRVRVASVYCSTWLGAGLGLGLGLG